jgi:hypothetical protein
MINPNTGNQEFVKSNVTRECGNKTNLTKLNVPVSSGFMWVLIESYDNVNDI